MKKVFIVFLCLCAVSCRKSESTLKMEGILAGPDLALCPCCGGVILELQGMNGDYRIDSLPFMTVQKLYNLSFPKRIQFDYVQADTCGSIIRFRITRYSISD